jgi:hypothetical protein
MTPRTASAAALVAAAAIACDSALAQTQQAPLPDVNVTAPGPAPPPAKAFSPFSTNTRVEESKWPEIPCNTARIALGPGSKCQNGGPTESFLTMSGGLANTGSNGVCDIAHQLAIIGNGRYQVEADVLIFDPYKITAIGHPDKNCFVWSGYTTMPNDFYDMNQVTRRGTGWRNFMKGDPQSTIEFSVGAKNCLAVERLGPHWHGGYVWVVHASICPATQAQLQNADIDAVFAMLELRQYDAQGNLRSP